MKGINSYLELTLMQFDIDRYTLKCFWMLTDSIGQDPMVLLQSYSFIAE